MAKLDKFVLAQWMKVAFTTPPDFSNFFGYYNKSPLSADNRHLLAHGVSFDGRNIEASDRADVGYFDLHDGSWRTLGTTRAFNWQQGSMLQWLGPDFESRVIFNDQEEDRFVARIVDVATGVQWTVPHAVYDVHPTGRRALGVRFERHYFCRAYHYEGIRDDRWNVPIHPEDGIIAIDLEDGKARLILYTADIASFEPTSAMAGASHWLEHLMWNQSGTRFSFLHRFGSQANYGTRVLTANDDGNGLFCLPEHAEHSYTHMGWRDDSTFVIFSVKSKSLGNAYASMVDNPNPLNGLVVRSFRALKRIIPREYVDRQRAESGYALVRDREKVERVLSTGMLRLDGHPSWTHDGRFMLTDTYADEAGYRHLLLYDAETGRVHTPGRFFSPFNNCGYRCDLHPRFSRDGEFIIIDTAHSGRHAILVLNVDWRQLR